MLISSGLLNHIHTKGNYTLFSKIALCRHQHAGSVSWGWFCSLILPPSPHWTVQSQGALMRKRRGKTKQINNNNKHFLCVKSRLLPSLSGGAQAGASQHFAGHRECKPDPKASSSACTQSCFLLGHALHCCQQSVWLHLVFFPFRMALVSCPEQTLPIQHLPELEDPQTSAGHLITFLLSSFSISHLQKHYLDTSPQVIGPSSSWWRCKMGAWTLQPARWNSRAAACGQEKPYNCQARLNRHEESITESFSLASELRV